MKEKFDGIIFDVDGTLWDSTDCAAASYNQIFAREGIPIRVNGNRLKGLFGKPMDVIFAELMPEADPDQAAFLAEACMELENEDLKREGAPVYPGVRETFAKLSERFPLFIVSNCQCGYIELVLEHAGIGAFVRDHLCFGDTHTSKGQTLLTLMRKHGLTHPVYVGDTEGDARACREAGIPIIYCRYGFGLIDEPYAVIDSIDALGEVLQ